MGARLWRRCDCGALRMLVRMQVSCAALPLADKATFLAYVKSKTATRQTQNQDQAMFLANNEALNKACGGESSSISPIPAAGPFARGTQ